ncbi:aldehyde dehydrogenase family 7 member A1 [Microbotryum lychnidis-dioicae p1A1 Lamole]|uniref:aldehyde dehydrogenase (NAD(+)) n=2 Tax=Microbotryum TaxID=34416 RepID=U5HEC2_USTV1|nr:aldehyde dehydrogenase family 7 member A1 [Microbotryum lychnidis-dioicae p1A1 Lamole]SGY16724.1 BQ5605_C012g06965 [Microbotryum silenes-dioicae]|eukprot:KDE04097.1 aldehyde dehydrogenase family 7 member A1 [Microbotryum lychnidis-dioicae p1A1 Lamole]
MIHLTRRRLVVALSPSSSLRTGGGQSYSASRTLSSAASSALSRLGLSSSSPNAGVYDGTSFQASGPLIKSINPSTGETIAQVIQASPEDTERVISSARKAYLSWRNVSAPNRGLLLREIAQTLRHHKDDLGLLVSLEMGKIYSEGKGEVQEIIDVADYAVGLSRSIGGSVVPSEREKHFITEVSNPLGVVGCITAFNFPVAVAGWNLALSLITGNAMVWKPSPSTPLTAIAMTKLMSKVFEARGHSGALASLVCGGAQVGEKLVNDKRVDLISFTGSEARGREVSMAVAGRFGKSILELGGNNAAIVLPDANIPLALRSILFAALGTAGQRCTTTRRLFLHSSIADSFIEQLRKAYISTSNRIGDPLDDSSLVGPLHGQDGVQKFKAAIEDAKKEGGEIIVGGRTKEMRGEFKGGNWVEPTIVRFKDATKAEVMKRETFAPILYISTFDTLEEAIELNNAVEQGLSSTLFTKDMSSAFQWIGPAGSDTGIVNVNGSTSGAEIGAPFGGNKSTGWGRESGGDAWKQYCRWSSCTLNWSDEVALAQGVKFE